MSPCRKGLMLLIALAVLAGCTSSPTVTSRGDPVTDTTVIAAAIAVHLVESSAVALGDSLIQVHKSACGGKSREAQAAEVSCVRATAVLKTYAKEYAPKIHAALLTAGDALRIAAAAPRDTTQETLDKSIEALRTALAAAVQWSRSEGYPALTTP